MSPWGKAPVKQQSVTCSLVTPTEVYLEPLAKRKIEVLMDKFPNLEWLAYLQGKVGKNGVILIHDIHVPPHKYQTGASAEAIPFHQPADTVGLIHSHHHMGAFHSGTDNDFVDHTYPVSITVAMTGDSLVYAAVSQQKTPCGKKFDGVATVKYVQPKPEFDISEFLEDALENIMRAGVKKAVENQLQSSLNLIDQFQGHYEHSYVDKSTDVSATEAKVKLVEDKAVSALKYRKGKKGKTVVTDASGRVLSESELKDLLREKK